MKARLREAAPEEEAALPPASTRTQAGAGGGQQPGESVRRYVECRARQCYVTFLHHTPDTLPRLMSPRLSSLSPVRVSGSALTLDLDRIHSYKVTHQGWGLTRSRSRYYSPCILSAHAQSTVVPRWLLALGQMTRDI